MGILTLLIRGSLVLAVVALLVSAIVTTAYGDMVVAGLADLASRLVGFVGVAFDSNIQGASVE